MSEARSEILGRIRSAVQESQPVASIERRYRRTGSLNQNELISLFEDRLNDYGAGVYQCAPEQIAITIEGTLATRSKRKVIAPANLPHEWRVPGLLSPENLSYAQLDETEGVLTGCSVAIAETGTIILHHSAGNGTRASTLIPDYHLCVVEASQIVETVPEGIERCQAFATSPITTISGPSATSDIQMMRVKGVHGPRVLDVIIAR